ncbi:MAG: DUF433 domain-containing protein [Calditrichaeota bacterium]|nr:MAG: DUF433 domain-containing protein [Calditrichota bacterium]
MNDRISSSPNVCHGKPVIKGTRVLVSTILGALAGGDAIDQILEDYPNITGEDIYAALQFGNKENDSIPHMYVGPACDAMHRRRG